MFQNAKIWPGIIFPTGQVMEKIIYQEVHSDDGSLMINLNGMVTK